MLDTIKTVDRQITVKHFVCSDGAEYVKSYDAETHEMLLRLEEIFAHIPTRFGKSMHHKKYYFTKKMALECGKYHIVARNADDMYILDHFFPYMYEKLGNPTEFPLDIYFEIYYDEDADDRINPHSLWRLCNRFGA